MTVDRCVKVLEDAGLITVDHGDGSGDGDEERDYPFIAIRTYPELLIKHADLILYTLRAHGVTMNIPRNFEGPRISINYDPIDKFTFIEVSDIHDDLLKKAN